MVDDNGDRNRLEKIAELVTGDQGAFDFERIIPRPAHIFCGILTSEMWRETRGRNWIDWNCENWGTKWNCYEAIFNGYDTWRFKTAWSHPSQ
jgi:hypothetical protein